MLATHDDRIASAVQRLGSENAFEVLARARQLEAQGRRVVHMEIGEPDFDTPEHIKKPPSKRYTIVTRTTRRRPASRRCARPSRNTPAASVTFRRSIRPKM